MTHPLSPVDDGTIKRRRLISEQDIMQGLSDPSACTVDDVLQLLQLLYAVSRDITFGSNKNITGMICIFFRLS